MENKIAQDLKNRMLNARVMKMKARDAKTRAADAYAQAKVNTYNAGVTAAQQQASLTGGGAWITTTATDGTSTMFPTSPGGVMHVSNTESVQHVGPTQPEAFKMYWAFLKGTSVIGVQAEVNPFGDVYSMELVNGRKITLNRIEDISELVAVICGFKESSYLLGMPGMSEWLLLEKSLR